MLYSQLFYISFVVSNMCFVAGQVELYYYHLFMKSDRFCTVLNSWHCNTKQFELMSLGNLMNRIYVAAYLLN
jgi:hypothetical protein